MEMVRRSSCRFGAPGCVVSSADVDDVALTSGFKVVDVDVIGCPMTCERACWVLVCCECCGRYDDEDAKVDLTAESG